MTDRTDDRRAGRAGRARAFVDTLGVHRGYPGLFLAAMLASALALLVAHVGHAAVGRPEQWYWHLGNDRGYGELLQYLQSGWGVVLLAVAWWRTRAPVLVAWAVVLGYFLLDDSLRLHEHYGWTLARAAGWVDSLGDTGGDLGELAYMALVGLVLVALVAVTHACSRGWGRFVSRRLAVLFAVLVVVGIGIDAVQTVLPDVAPLTIALTVLEDGGELVVLSVVVTYLLRVAHEAGAADGA